MKIDALAKKVENNRNSRNEKVISICTMSETKSENTVDLWDFLNVNYVFSDGTQISVDSISYMLDFMSKEELINMIIETWFFHYLIQF